MKSVLDLTRAIGNYDYYYSQFSKWGDEKNILFVSPQLSGNGLYKMILPFFSMFSEKVATAITSLNRYDYREQLLGGDDFTISDEMIEWADFIVFPFTTQPLVVEYYERIRSIKKDARIVFLVDFNFYELTALHPYKFMFDEPIVLSAVEDNIWFSDICLTSNQNLAGYIVNKFGAYAKSKYANTPSFLRVACMPYMIDTDIVLKNVNYEPLAPILVNNETHISETKKHIESVSKVAEQDKALSIEQEKMDKEKKNKKEQDTENEDVVEDSVSSCDSSDSQIDNGGLGSSGDLSNKESDVETIKTGDDILLAKKGKQKIVDGVKTKKTNLDVKPKKQASKTSSKNKTNKQHGRTKTSSGKKRR